MKYPFAALAAVLLAVPGAADAPPTFRKKPTVTKSAGGVKVEFTADRETDVAVYVEDAGGKGGGHLAAGVRGKTPPEPLRPNALAQSLEWDGKDDFGKPAAGRPFKVRVR